MSNLTSELNLNQAVEDDDTDDYLTISLADSLNVIDGLFNSSTGHAHNGSHQGGTLEFLDLTVGEDLTVVGQSILQGPVLAQNSLHVIGTTTLDGGVTSLHVTGTSALDGAVTLGAGLTVGTDATITRDLIVGRNVGVTGNIGVSTLNVSGSASINNLTATNVALNGSLSGSGVWSAGPTTTDWFRCNTIGTGIYNAPAVQGIGFNASGAFLHPSADPIVGASATQTLRNKSEVDPHIVGPSLNFSIGANDLTNYQFAFAGSGALTLPAVGSYKGVFRAVKAWGGDITINCGTTCIIGPGSAGAIVASFVLRNGDSCTFWSDGGNWWCL